MKFYLSVILTLIKIKYQPITAMVVTKYCTLNAQLLILVKLALRSNVTGFQSSQVLILIKKIVII